jgi:hypothetical protein
MKKVSYIGIYGETGTGFLVDGHVSKKDANGNLRQVKVREFFNDNGATYRRSIMEGLSRRTA